MPLEFTESANNAFGEALGLANSLRHECVTPEHFLAAFLKQKPFVEALERCNLNADALKEIVGRYLSCDAMECVPKDVEYNVGLSVLLQEMITRACVAMKSSNRKVLDMPNLVQSFLKLRKSIAADMLRDLLGKQQEAFLTALNEAYANDKSTRVVGQAHVSVDTIDMGGGQPFPPQGMENPSWQRFASEFEPNLSTPIVGRKKELERMANVLSRQNKNCAMLVGEPGVGKTAMLSALQQYSKTADAPSRIQKCPMYQLDVTALYANAQFRGEMEKCMKAVLEGIKELAVEATDERTGRKVIVTPIIVIDDIHHLVGSSRGQDGSMDVSHLLKPYIDGGTLRFIGTTTHEDYTRYVAKNKSLTRRFQQIEIKEPSVEETVEILTNHRKEIERFHHVSITEPIIRHAIELSAKYISDRFLPEKAIELLDEAATLTELRAPADSASKLRVKMTTVDEALANVAKIDAMAIKGDDLESLATLEERIKSQIFGQDEAIQKLVEAVQMSKSGLTDDGKPVASMLFVGPTGVGKTEVAKVLAKELGVELIRFDMSEYTEKHTVAKLIGSPAGYIGYDDGGLLTDAIRKTPYCVLLLDEIEKAHSDIYNILLQVMDYAQLTDNKGNKADFKNVILLMTSNAGAQHARKANIGFGSGVSTGEAMMKQVKQTFKPEFINRLSATVVFHDMDKQMARLILDKKLRGFREKLAAKKVTLNLSDEAYEWLLEKGFTPEYGAREMDRVVAQYLKPLLMRSILFGKMKKGGEAVVSVKDGELWMK